MLKYCLPKFLADKFKQALQSGELHPDKLEGMKSVDRRAAFEKVLGKEDAKRVNTLFEEKINSARNREAALLRRNAEKGMDGMSDVQKARLRQLKDDAMIRLINGVTGLSESVKSDMISRVLKNADILNPKSEEEFLADLASKKTGGGEVSIEDTQKALDMANIAERTKELAIELNATEIPKETTDEIAKLVKQSKGALTKEDFKMGVSGESNASIIARNGFNNYMASLHPLSVWKSMGDSLATWGRNMLLMNPSTPIKSFLGQFTNSVTDFFTRRLGSLSAKGKVPTWHVLKTSYKMWQTFLKTSTNTASMESLNDSHVLGRGENFRAPTGTVDTNPVLKGAELVMRKGAQIANKVAIDWAHNVPFTANYITTFTDSANIFSSKFKNPIAVFDDAMKIEPTTDEGKLVRLQSQIQAARITSTNETWASRFSMGIKSTFDKAFPTFPLGKWLVPMAKIPSTLIANAIDNSGVGLPKGALDIYKGIKTVRKATTPDETWAGTQQWMNGLQRVARNAGMVGIGALLAYNTPKQDFKTDNYGVHYVLVGDHWINLEYLAVLNPAYAGAMLAKEGKTPAMQAFGYARGVAESLIAIPGIDEASQLVTAATNANSVKGAVKYLNNFGSSRIVPAIILNMLKDRPFERIFTGAHGFETVAEVHRDAVVAARAKKKP